MVVRYALAPLWRTAPSSGTFTFHSSGARVTRIVPTVVAVLLLAMPASAQRRTPLDLVLVGGRVLDPETRLDAVRAVGVRGGRIVSVTEAVPAARETLSVGRLVVAPGFVDLHAHGQDSLNYRYA